MTTIIVRTVFQKKKWDQGKTPNDPNYQYGSNTNDNSQNTNKPIVRWDSKDNKKPTPAIGMTTQIDQKPHDSVNNEGQTSNVTPNRSNQNNVYRTSVHTP